MNQNKILSLLILLLSINLFFSCQTALSDESGQIILEANLFGSNIDMAKKGDELAQIKVAMSYEKGLGVSKNLEEAYNWYRRAANKGNAMAFYHIGSLYERGLYVQQSYSDALEWYLSSATLSYGPAIRKMIKFNENNEAEKMKWIELGAKNNDPYSAYYMALVHEKDDPHLALEYFAKSVEIDDPQIKAVLAMKSLGMDKPLFMEQESLTAIEKGAAMGQTRSQVFWAWINEFSYKRGKNLKVAFLMYEKAAEQNDMLGIYNLSRFYREGLFVQKDEMKAELLLKRIPMDFYSQVLVDLEKFADLRFLKEQQLLLYQFHALTNNAEAFYNIGLLSPPEDALQWYWLAAEASHVPAMIALGREYMESEPIRAALWFMMAENRSGEKLKEINLSQYMSTMSDDEKMEVSRLFTEKFYNN